MERKEAEERRVRAFALNYARRNSCVLVFVVITTGMQCTFIMQPHSTISDIKERLSALIEEPPVDLRLIYVGKDLNDRGTVESLDQQTLTLVVRHRGGTSAEDLAKRAQYDAEVRALFSLFNVPTMLRLVEQRESRSTSWVGANASALPPRWVPLSGVLFDPHNDAPKLLALFRYLIKNKSRGVPGMGETTATLLYDGSSTNPNHSSVLSNINVYVAVHNRVRYFLFRHHQAVLRQEPRPVGRRRSTMETVTFHNLEVPNPDGDNARLEDLLDGPTLACRMAQFRNKLIDGMFTLGHVRFDSRLEEVELPSESEGEWEDETTMETEHTFGSLSQMYWGWKGTDGRVMWRYTNTELADDILSKTLCSGTVMFQGCLKEKDITNYGGCAPLEASSQESVAQESEMQEDEDRMVQLVTPAVPSHLLNTMLFLTDFDLANVRATSRAWKAQILVVKGGMSRVRLNNLGSQMQRARELGLFLHNDRLRQELQTRRIPTEAKYYAAKLANGHTLTGLRPGQVKPKEVGGGVQFPMPNSMREVPSYYMDQIQGVMNVMDLDVCDFVQYLPEKNELKEVLHTVSVRRDKAYWTNVLQPKLLAFYNGVYIPALLLKLNGPEAMEVQEEDAQGHVHVEMMVE